MANTDDLDAITSQLATASALLGEGIDAAARYGETSDRLGEDWDLFSTGLYGALELLAETLAEIPVDRSRPGVHALDKLLEEVAGLAMRFKADRTGVALREITARLVPVHDAVVTLVRDLNAKLESSKVAEELELLKQQRAGIEATEASLAAAQEAIYAVFNDFDRLGGHPAIWSDMDSVVNELKEIADACDERVASGE